MVEKLKTWLAWLGAAATAFFVGFLLAGRRKVEPPISSDVNKALRDTEDAADRAAQVIQEERAKLEERREQLKRLDERRRQIKRMDGKLPVIFLLVFLLGAAPVLAEAPKLPDSYDQLVELYLQVVDRAAQYRALYLEAEASNERLLAELEVLREQVKQLTETVAKQQQLIERQQQSLLNLLDGLEVRVGVDASGLSPIQLTPWIAVSYRF